jgi:acetyltransferase
MSIRNLDSLLHPKSVALIGASSREGSVGAAFWKNLNSAKFHGPLFAVNLKYKTIDGVPVYQRVKDIPDSVDLAIICTPPETVVGLMTELGKAKVKAVIVNTVGLSDSQTQGMLKAAKPYLLRVVGSNCLGVLTPKIGLNASLSATDSLSGELAFVSQSGGLVTAILDWANDRDIGFSHLISLGESSDVDMADILDILGSDSSTKAIVLYAESIQFARKFMSAARAAARNKPVIMLRPGHGSPVRFNGASTAEFLIDSDLVFNAAIRRAGLLQVKSLQELLTATMALTRRDSRKSKKLFVLTNTRAAGVIAADRGAQKKISVAFTEIDHTASVQRYVEQLQLLLQNSEDSQILLIHSPIAMVSSLEIAKAGLPVIESDRHRVMSCWLGGESVIAARDVFRQAGIADYSTPEEAVNAFSMMQNYWRNQELLMEVPLASETDIKPNLGTIRAMISEAIAEGRPILSKMETQTLLSLYGIPNANAGEGEGAVPLFAGTYVDAVFGPVVLFGRRGGNTDLSNDIVIGIPPLNSILADDLIASTQVAKEIASFENRTRSQSRGVSDVLVGLASLVADIPEIAQIHIDPLILNVDGVDAAAASVTLSPLRPGGTMHFSILPYPDSLVESVVWRGENIVLRPIRPEDEAQHRRFLEQLTPEDVRMRIFFTKRELSRSELARLTQVDYDREMAFIAVRDAEHGATQTLAAVRIVSDPDGFSAEFALVVRSDLKRQGLGRLMLSKAVTYARAKGLKQLVGTVLHKNTAMKELVVSVGFIQDSTVPAEDETRSIVLKL